MHWVEYYKDMRLYPRLFGNWWQMIINQQWNELINKKLEAAASEILHAFGMRRMFALALY